MIETRTSRVGLSLASALAALLIAPVLAQDPPSAPAGGPASEAEPVDEVIVRGRRLGEIEDDLRIYIKEFVDETVAPARGRGFARWDRGVCVGVHNLKTPAAQYIIDRVSALALEVGLEPGEPGCAPQVHIVFSTDAQQMAARMVEEQPRAFRPTGAASGMDLGEFALEKDFVESAKAVRWWHVSLPVSAHSGAAAIELPQTRDCPSAPNCAPWINVQGPSRVHSGVRDEMQYVIIIVDATRLTGTTWQQLGDYVALISLAQIDPGTDPQSFDSILNLFSNPAAYSGLTDWDRTFVHALYSSNPERDARVQEIELIGRIARRELSTDD